jgi:hypothetical protein
MRELPPGRSSIGGKQQRPNSTANTCLGLVSARGTSTQVRKSACQEGTPMGFYNARSSFQTDMTPVALFGFLNSFYLL